MILRRSLCGFAAALVSRDHVYCARELEGAFTIRATIAFFRSIGLPGWFVYVIITVELVGGACLILGVVPRYVALLLVREILGTIVMVHGKNGWLFSNRGGGWRLR